MRGGVEGERVIDGERGVESDERGMDGERGVQDGKENGRILEDGESDEILVGIVEEGVYGK